MTPDKLFLDTNVIIDLLGEREQFYSPIAKIATLADKGQVKLFASALSWATVFYILSRHESTDSVREKIRKFRIITDTIDLTDTIIEKGLSSKLKDFEDALQYHCALAADCTLLVTRNEKDFKTSDIPVMNPEEYLSSII